MTKCTNTRDNHPVVFAQGSVPLIDRLLDPVVTGGIELSDSVGGLKLSLDKGGIAAEIGDMDAARDIHYCSLITTMSRNGVDFALHLSATGDACIPPVYNLDPNWTITHI